MDDWPAVERGQIDRLRNRVAQRLSNLVLRIGTPSYRAMVKVFVEYGMDSLARDFHEGCEQPPNWREWTK